MFKSGKILITTKAFKRKRCMTWVCSSPATHYVLEKGKTYAACCATCAKEWRADGYRTLRREKLDDAAQPLA